MSKKHQPSIPIVVNGKDICRLIIHKPDTGKYEIKIDFLKNDFDVNVFRMFSFRPLHKNVKEPYNCDISYHRGENNKPITIHLKNRAAQSGELKYESLPLKHLQAPNINSIFPIPLMKLELPNTI